MTTTIGDLTPFVRAEIPEVPDAVAIQYLVRGARDFCRRSRCYVQDTILSFISSQSDYNLLNDVVLDGASTIGIGSQEVVGIRGIVLADGTVLNPTTPQQLNSMGVIWRYEDGAPKWYYLQEDNEHLSIVRRPTTTDKRSVTGVTLTSTDPVVVTLSTEAIGGVTSHHFGVGDTITFYDTTDITASPEAFNGVRFKIIAPITTTTVTLGKEDGTDTDSTDYAGTWSSGGTCHRNSAYLELITQPIIATTTLPAQLCQRYGEALISGALMFLYGTPQKPWTDGALFSYHKSNLEISIDRARSEAQDRHLKRVARTVKYGGVGGGVIRQTRYGNN